MSRCKIDVMLISETQLSPNAIPKIKNYNFYKKDRNGVLGGNAIYIRNKFDHTETDIPELENMEANAVILNTASLGPILLVSAYNSPSRTIIQEDLNLILDSQLPTIIAGDLNAKHPSWHSRTTNRRGRILYQYSEDNLTIAAPEEPNTTTIEDTDRTFSISPSLKTSKPHSQPQWLTNYPQTTYQSSWNWEKTHKRRTAIKTIKQLTGIDMPTT